MTPKPIAVQGCTLTLSPPGGTVQITTPPSQKVKADGKGCYAGTLTVQISAYAGGAITVPGSGSGSDSLDGSATKCKIDGKAAVLEGDQVTITVNGKAVAGTTTVDASQSVTVTIQSAGQTKVKTE